MKDIPEDLMAIASAIGRERARCRRAVEAWRTRLAAGDDLGRSIELLLARIEAGGGTMQQAPAGDDDAVLVALRRKLHEAARVAERQLLAMADCTDIAQEVATIEAILQPGEVIADCMLCLRPVTSGGVEARLCAEVWKRGEYIGTYLGGE